MASARSSPVDVDWHAGVFRAIKAADVRQMPYVPDAGHSDLIKWAEADPIIKSYPLTTEEEGVAAVSGAWLGGERAVLLMQSSGAGNCINMLSLIAACRFPFLALVTMRGEWAEFNPWQVPMGRATQGCFELMGVSVRRVTDTAKAETEVAAALDDAFLAEQPVAVLFSQSLIGRKSWLK